MSNRTHRLGAVITATALASGLTFGLAQPALAHPLSAPVRQNPALKTIATKIPWKWLKEKTIDAAYTLIVQEGLTQLWINATSKSDADAQAKAFLDSIPTVSPTSVRSPETLVQFAKPMSGFGHNGKSVVRSSDPRALFRAVTAGGQRIGNNEYKQCVQTVKFSPGTSSAPPAITVSNAVITTKVVIIQ